MTSKNLMMKVLCQGEASARSWTDMSLTEATLPLARRGRRKRYDAQRSSLKADVDGEPNRRYARVGYQSPIAIFILWPSNDNRYAFPLEQEAYGLGRSTVA